MVGCFEKIVYNADDEGPKERAGDYKGLALEIIEIADGGGDVSGGNSDDIRFAGQGSGGYGSGDSNTGIVVGFGCGGV